MKRFAVALLLAFAISAAASARAEMSPVPPSDDYDEMQAHPLRIAAYLIHPIGFTLEWLVFRPFHRLVAQQSLAPVFGHTPHSDEGSTTY
jgi:hypothetical protein